VRSVLLQGYFNLEYFICDGGSNDESVEILRRYEPFLSGGRRIATDPRILNFCLYRIGWADAW
jgi:glycosyltransferase involved in cell wall biosynthesis